MEKPIQTSKTASRSGLYLHLMKCGGSSVHQVFRDYSNLHVTHGQGFLIIQDRPFPHIEYGYTNFHSVDFSWTCVRNPFSRLASVQHVFNARHHNRLPMDKFLEIAKLSGIRADRTDGINSIHEIWTHSRPYSWYPLDELDYIGRFEEMERVWGYVQTMLGIDDYLPHINQSGRTGHYMDKFTSAQQKLVREIYHEDFEIYYPVD